ncbi:MAG: hypothetical protein RL339_2008 [Pseudomonadota bacterium]
MVVQPLHYPASSGSYASPLLRAWLTGIAALALGQAQSASAAAERLTIIANGEVTGYVAAEERDGRTTVDYHVDNNGRGPRHREEIVLGANGVPVLWSVTGTSLMGGPVSESYRWADGTATWSSQADRGEAKVAQPLLYILNDDSPWAEGIYARAALAAGGSLPVLPNGELRISKVRDLSVGTAAITIYRLDGIALAPSYVALDARQNLFASFGPTGAAIQAGAEAEAPRFLALAQELEQDRIRQISAAVAHRFAGPVRLRGVHVFNPATGLRGPRSTVVVLRDRITQVLPDDGGPAPADQAVIDGAGGTVYPGLHDMHSHTSLDSGLYYLAAGVTQTRDMGNSNAFLQALLPRLAAGEIAGPHVVPAGFIEGRSPYSARHGFVVNSLAGALDAVRWYGDRGYREIKLYNSFNPDWVRPVAAEARRLGMGTTGHVPAFGSPDRAIADGYDTIAHINQLMLGWVLKPGEDTRTPLRLTGMARAAELDLRSAPVRKTVAAMKRKGTALDTTAMTLERLMLSRAGEVAEADAPYLAHMPIGYQRYRQRSFVEIASPGEDARYRKGFDRLVETLGLLHRSGIKLLPGTDDATGVSVHRELELYVRAGLTPAAALSAATLTSAAYLGQDGQRGTIAPGKLAELVLVAGNPTTDISAIRQPRMVMAGGAIYYPAEIYRELGIKPFAQPPAMTGPGPVHSDGLAGKPAPMLFGTASSDHAHEAP